MEWFKQLNDSIKLYISSVVLKKNKACILSNKGFDLIDIICNQSTSKEIERMKLIAELYIRYNMPLSKIFNEIYFWNKSFYTNWFTLDARSSTELLIESILKYIPTPPKTILELGVGTGALIISLLEYYPNAKCTAIDICEKVLKVTQKNCERYNANITLIKNDWLNNINEPFDLCIANPPYILPEEKINDYAMFDPQKALFHKDPLWFYKEIEKKHHLFKYIALEFSSNNETSTYYTEMPIFVNNEDKTHNKTHKLGASRIVIINKDK